ncbi:MAG: GHKL domain-containing protein [Clostridia bacterium]|nr:GHKL domain-containing protein [Clostridia bacterium]
MGVLSECARSSPVMYMLFSVINAFLIVAGCSLTVAGLFKIRPGEKTLPYVVSAALVLITGVSRPYLMNSNEFVELLGAAAHMIMPFVCVLLIFPKNHVKKILTTVIGYTLVEAVKYIILTAFCHYDGEHLDDITEIGVEFAVDAAFFIAAAGFLMLVAKKRSAPFAITRISPIVFVFICLTVGVFITSVVLFGGAPSSGKNIEFAFVLMNVPLFAATLALIVGALAKDKTREENYKNRLEMQVRHYEMMRRIDDDMRVFRHDFPKKLRPMLAYIDAGETEKAMRIADGLAGFVSGSGSPFHTGNASLDTVLFCEQQIAGAEGHKIVFSFGSVFPEKGIADDDIYTIFPNALDNAIEACGKTGGPCEITVDSKIVGNTVYVSIANPYKGELKIKDGIPVTKKADKDTHGYGFRSIKKAAANYGENNVSFVAGDGRFELRISLNFN